MAPRMTIEWLETNGAGGIGPARAPFARVLLCDLRNPALDALAAIAPNPGDLADVNYPGASDRSHFLRRRLVMRSLAARCAGLDARDIRIAYDAHGAPRVDGARLYVAASSRGAQTALAVASLPIGVDLEQVEDGAPVIDEVLGKSEREALARIAGGARARAFLQMWTAKEAYLKAMGRGFKRNPALVCIDVRGTSFNVEDTGFPAELAAGAFAPSPEPGFIAACAVLAQESS